MALCARSTPPELYDELLYVEDREALAICRALDAAIDVKLGGSGGAALAACARYLQAHPTVERAVCICADRGEHYSSSIYSDSWLTQNKLDVDRQHLGPVSKISS